MLQFPWESRWSFNRRLCCSCCSSWGDLKAWFFLFCILLKTCHVLSFCFIEIIELEKGNHYSSEESFDMVILILVIHEFCSVEKTLCVCVFKLVFHWFWTGTCSRWGVFTWMLDSCSNLSFCSLLLNSEML